MNKFALKSQIINIRIFTGVRCNSICEADRWGPGCGHQCFCDQAKISSVFWPLIGQFQPILHFDWSIRN